MNTYADLLGHMLMVRIVSAVGRDPQRVPQPSLGVTPNAYVLPVGLSYSEIWNALDRVRRSQTMRSCHRLIQLLTFVVDATLKGEAGHLKETTIGVFVFGRAPDYDPKADTIVRSQARRLRARLKQYYQSEGSLDPLLIEIPLGRYIPVFSQRGHKTDLAGQ